MAMANRLHWIDTTKAICIICVYFAHCAAFTTGNINLIKAVSPFYVNAFFFISGYLLCKKYLQENTISNFASQAYLSGVKTCIFKIVIPTIIFSSMICIPKALLHNYTIDYKILIIDIWGGSSFWFTSALAVAQLVILTLFLTKNRNIFFYLVITALIFLATQYLCDFTPHPARFYFPWYWRTGLIYTFVLILGGVYYTFEKEINLFLHKGGVIAIATISIYTYFYLYRNDNIFFLGLSGRCTTLGFIGAISTTLLLIFILRRCSSYTITDFIGKNSIVFYFFSGAVPNTIAALMNRLLNGNELFIATFTLSIIISYIITLVICNYFPFLTDIRKVNMKAYANFYSSNNR